MGTQTGPTCQAREHPPAQKKKPAGVTKEDNQFRSTGERGKSSDSSDQRTRLFERADIPLRVMNAVNDGVEFIRLYRLRFRHRRRLLAVRRSKSQKCQCAEVIDTAAARKLPADRANPQAGGSSETSRARATSLTKSVLVGLIPRAELKPIFSPTDCASVGLASNKQPSSCLCPQLAALRLTPFRSAMVLSLVLAAFSSFKFVVRNRTMSS